MRHVLAILGLMVLASCGADGEPVRPEVGGTFSIGTGGVKTTTTISGGTNTANVSVSF